MIGKYALTAAALLQLASAQDGSTSAVVTGDGTTDVSGEDWASVARNPNMTQHVEFEGRDVSASYPGEAQDWSLHFSLKDDIETDNDKELTGSTISIEGPDGEVEFDDSWRLCLHVFNVKDSSADGYGSATDGCQGIVADECIDDLRKRAISNYGSGCPVYKATDSCLRDIEEGSSSSTVAITSDNAESLIGGNSTFFRRGFGTHEPNPSGEEPASLMDAAGRAQAVIAVFGAADDSEEPYVGMTCVLADTATEGSWDPEAEAEGAASAFGAFAGWAALTAAVAYQLL